MNTHGLSAGDWLKAVGIGLATGVLLSAVMVPAMRLGLSPMPAPLGLAFADTVLGRSLPLPVGLLFHLVYVTFWSVVAVLAFRDALSLRRIGVLALVLWIVVLVVFFPVVGWGILGLGVGPELIVGSFVPHVLFAVFLWALAKLAFGRMSRVGYSS